ncbi:MAG: BrnT family toxin [Butyrivibrio sp.]|uniref:BrnT family toxin n=1 Tax=Butyrivibrio sp. TaxID=28121 RepID=UPI001B0CE209|nr:BrnT family toxin [Butyrivibrio sp.]MBO6240973.1 BrnT family toxin [Butyrivibrio sp.]
MEELIFEWDDEKEQKNIRKHKIDFSTAAHVFSDDYRIEKYDGKHSEDEDRYKVIGAINGYLMIIVVSYTMRKNDKVIRMISARKAEKEEREEYYGNY